MDYTEENDDRSDWTRKLDDAAKNWLEKHYPGVPYEDHDERTIKEAYDHAVQEVGPNPDSD